MHGRNGQRATRVFISYSRKDQEFVRSLHAALQQREIDTWVDWEGIPLTADYVQEIYAGIDAADVFLFILSPDSVASDSCRLEVAHAAEHQKRLVPVVHADVDAKAVPAELGRLNWIFFRDGDPFEPALAALLEGITLDVEWLHAHTRLLTRGLEWRRAGRHPTLLAAGADLRETEESVRIAVGADPQLTQLQMEYLQASREAAVDREARRRATTGTVAVGAIWGAAFVPIGVMLSGAVVGTGPQQLVLAVIVASLVGLVTAAAFGVPAFGALSLERRRQRVTLRRPATPMLVTALGAMTLGCVAGLEGGYVALVVSGAVPDWLTLLIATAVAVLLDVAMLDRLVFSLTRVRQVTPAGRRGNQPEPVAGTLELRGMGPFRLILSLIGAADLGLALALSSWLAQFDIVPRTALAAAIALVVGALAALALTSAARTTLMRGLKSGPARSVGLLSSGLSVIVGTVYGSATAAMLLRAVIAAGQRGLLPDSFAGPFEVASYPVELVAAVLIAIACASVVMTLAQRALWPQGEPTRAESARSDPVAAPAPSSSTPGEKHATRAFISYSRRDKPFVQRLHDGLQQWQMDTWVDWKGIPLTADWLREIQAAIEASDVFVFVISPDSVSSEVCGVEIAHAAEHHKRLVPVVYRQVDVAAVPEPLRRLNWVFFREGDDFDTALRQLSGAVELDLDWLHAHTRLLTDALEWEGKLRHRSLLLRGRAFREIAEAFASARQESGPLLTALQLEYVGHSWNAATRATARMAAWLLSLVFGGVCGAIVVVAALTTAGVDVGLPTILGVAIFAAVVGCCLGSLAAFATLKLEPARKEPSGERKLPVAVAVLIATITGSGGVLALIAAAVFPNRLTGTVFSLLNHPVWATVAAAVVAVLMVWGVLLPNRRLHPFHSAADVELATARVRRQRAVKRLAITLAILAAVEVGCAGLAGDGTVGPLGLAFLAAGGCVAVVLVAQKRSPAVAWARHVVPIVGAFAGAVWGLGLTILASEILVVPGSFVAALVAANAVLALQPRPARLQPQSSGDRVSAP